MCAFACTVMCSVSSVNTGLAISKFPVLRTSPNINYITVAELNTDRKRPETPVHNIKTEDQNVICNSSTEKRIEVQY
jgi:hypothetical protein